MMKLTNNYPLTGCTLFYCNIIGASGRVQFSQVVPTSYVLKVVAKRPGKRIVERRVLHILGKSNNTGIEFYSSCTLCIVKLVIAVVSIA